MHQLNGVPLGDAGLAQAWPAHDLSVELHHDRTRVETQVLEQLQQGRVARNAPRLAVDRDGNRTHVPSVHGASSASAAAAGSGARQRAVIAATPYAPAAR